MSMQFPDPDAIERARLDREVARIRSDKAFAGCQAIIGLIILAILATAGFYAIQILGSVQ